MFDCMCSVITENKNKICDKKENINIVSVEALLWFWLRQYYSPL